MTLSKEEWDYAINKAAEIAPLPAISPILAGVTGAFGAALVASVALTLAGSDIDLLASRRAVGATALICGAIGYFFFKSQEKRHHAAFERIARDMETSPFREGNRT